MSKFRKGIETQGFQSELPLAVKRPFRAGGRKYEKGQTFPWRDLGVSPEKVAIMFRTGLVHHRTGYDDNVSSIAEAAPAAPARPARTSDASKHDPILNADGLLDLGMKDLRRIAQEEGAGTTRTLAGQVKLIRENREAKAKKTQTLALGKGSYNMQMGG